MSWMDMKRRGRKATKHQAVRSISSNRAWCMKGRIKKKSLVGSSRNWNMKWLIHMILQAQQCVKLSHHWLKAIFNCFTTAACSYYTVIFVHKSRSRTNENFLHLSHFFFTYGEGELLPMAKELYLSACTCVEKYMAAAIA